MFTWSAADRSGRGRRHESRGAEEWRSGLSDRTGTQTEGGVGHMLAPADDTGMTWRSKGRLGAERG